MTKEQAIKELTIIPGVGKSLATDLWNIGISSISDLTQTVISKPKRRQCNHKQTTKN
jgi:predicted RecB family nuclease